MKRKEIKQKIRKAYRNATPEIFEQINGEINNGSDGENIVQFVPNVKKKKTFSKITGIAAAAGIVLGIGLSSNMYARPAACIAIDVNPSIELKINSRERVVSCVPLNRDAEIIIDEMDFRGSDIDVATNALIGSMVKNGFISEMKNSVLVTVSDAKDGAALEKKLAEEISQAIEASVGNAAVISQHLTKTAELEALAVKYGISQGKAELINNIIANESTLEFSELARLSVNELNLIVSARHTQAEEMTVTGKASTKSYIGTEKAKEKALKVYPDAVVEEIELDYENGKMVYEVEMKNGAKECEVIIDAVNGEIIRSSVESENDNDDKYDDHDDSFDAAGDIIEDKFEKENEREGGVFDRIEDKIENALDPDDDDDHDDGFENDDRDDDSDDGEHDDD